MRRVFAWFVFLVVAGGALFYLRRPEGQLPPRRPAPVSTVPATRILFIGNSLTYSAQMPQLLYQLARAGGIDVDYATHAPGGTTLRQHSEDAEVQRLLAAGRWDVLVLQGESQETAFNPDFVASNVDKPVRFVRGRAR